MQLGEASAFLTWENMLFLFLFFPLDTSHSRFQAVLSSFFFSEVILLLAHHVATHHKGFSLLHLLASPGVLLLNANCSSSFSLKSVLKIFY